MGVYDIVYMKHTSSNAHQSHANILRRLKLIEGQIRGLQNMVEQGKYCIDIITQTSAVKRGLSGVEDLLLESHLSHCVMGQVATGHAGKATQEVLKVYKLKRS